MASGRAKAALGSGLGAVALAITYLTVPWEGTENRAYWDSLGNHWTICSGETLNVVPGMVKTNAQCLTDTYRRMEADYHQPLTRCISGFDHMPTSVQAAFLDLAWNIGVPTVCTSTAAARARIKNWPATCEAMSWFNRAGGRVINGLDLRRKDGDAERIGERELCLAGIPK